MREIQLPLNQTQKLRLQRALEQLEYLSSDANSNASVTVADTIPVNYQDGVLKGHGTIDLDGELIATVCGVVERVNKLVYVCALRARYKPEIGDIIVGRVIEVAAKRWRLDINFSQDAVLMLSSMNLPDGIQEEYYREYAEVATAVWCKNQGVITHPLRLVEKFLRMSLHQHVQFDISRRTAVDELNMRSIFEENHVVCAEVRGFQHDGSLHLQARSQKYGKLERGQLLTVPPYLVKRRKQHFHYLEEYRIDLIIGCNGFIWVGEHVEPKDDMVEDQVTKSEQQNVNSRNTLSFEEQERTYTPLEIRQNICRTANAVRVLSTLGFNVTVDAIMETVKLSSSLNPDIHEMLGAEFCVSVAESEAKRRRSLTKKKG